MHQPVLADVHIPGTGAASPFARTPFRNRILKLIVYPRDVTFLAAAHRLIDGPFPLTERLQLAIAIVDNPQSGRESQLDCPLTYHQGILWVANAAANH